MLRRQNFRGCHERALATVLRRLCQSEGGDYRLSRTDVALYQAAHGFVAFHVGAYFSPGSLLRLRHIKRQCGDYFSHGVAVRHMPYARSFPLRSVFYEKKPTLNEVQFFKCQP